MFTDPWSSIAFIDVSYWEALGYTSSQCILSLYASLPTGLQLLLMLLIASLELLISLFPTFACDRLFPLFFSFYFCYTWDSGGVSWLPESGLAVLVPSHGNALTPWLTAICFSLSGWSDTFHWVPILRDWPWVVVEPLDGIPFVENDRRLYAPFSNTRNNLQFYVYNSIYQTDPYKEIYKPVKLLHRHNYIAATTA